MDKKKILKYKCMDIYVTTQNEIIYVCLLCKNHIQYENINIHIKEHFNKLDYNLHEYDQYQCDNENSAYKNSINIHNNNNYIKYDNKKRKVKSNEKKFSNKYLCYYCNEEFIHPHERLQHLIKHIKNTPKNQIPVVANENVVAVDIEDLQNVKQQQQHKQNEKILISIWTCDICCLEFHNNNRFNDHILEHKNGYLPTNLETKKPKKKYKYDSYKRKRKTLDEYHICHVCGIRMADITNLKNHIDTHTGEKRYQCEICEKRFTQSTALKNHMRTHTNEKSINCTLCDRKFRINADLRSHMYRHNNIRRHECTYCEKKFYESDQLKAHIRTHTGEKPFQCDICKEYFRTRYCMKTHRRLHTGEKPFKCRICEKPFAQLAGLHGHMKSCKKKLHEMI